MRIEFYRKGIEAGLTPKASLRRCVITNKVSKMLKVADTATTLEKRCHAERELKDFLVVLQSTVNAVGLTDRRYTLPATRTMFAWHRGEEKPQEKGYYIVAYRGLPISVKTYHKILAIDQEENGEWIWREGENHVEDKRVAWWAPLGESPDAMDEDEGWK